jgi:hypothetical protein
LKPGTSLSSVPSGVANFSLEEKKFKKGQNGRADKESSNFELACTTDPS